MQGLPAARHLVAGARIPHVFHILSADFQGLVNHLALDDTRAEVHIAMLDEQGRANLPDVGHGRIGTQHRVHLGRLPRIPAEMIRNQSPGIPLA